MFIPQPGTIQKQKRNIRYFILYHGGGEDETGWPNQGKTDFIMG